jgi:hypothetical protein
MKFATTGRVRINNSLRQSFSEGVGWNQKAAAVTVSQQVEIKSKAAQIKSKMLIRRTCPNGHGSNGSGPK